MEGQQFYDPNAVNTSLGGVALEGFADGSMIEVSPVADDYEAKVGTKGAVGLARIYNPMREVKIRLLKTSPSNDRLSALRRTSRAAPGATVASQLSLRDGSGTSVVTGKAVIKRPPNQVFSNTVEAYEWILLVRVDEQTENVGGNSIW